MKIEINVPIKGIMKIIGIGLLIGIIVLINIRSYNYELNWHGIQWDLCDSIEDKGDVAYFQCVQDSDIGGQSINDREYYAKQKAIWHTLPWNIPMIILLLTVIYFINEEFL